MNINEFILDLYKKGHTPKYIAKLIYKKVKTKGSNQTFENVLNKVEKTILELYTTKERSSL